MNTTRVITMICWIVSALVLIGLLIWFLTGSIFGIGGGSMFNWFRGINIGGFENLTGPFISQGTQTSDASNIHSLDISWVSGEITVIPHDGNDIQVTEYTQRDLKDNERMHINESGGTLTIRFRERSNISVNMPRKNLEVLVPHSLSDDMTKLKISTTSGNINVENFKTATADISSVSASIDTANLTSKSIDISTTSGAISVSSVRADETKISSVSGAISLTDAFVITLDTNTTSGRTNVTGEFDKVDVSTVSGGTTVKSAIIPSRINVSSVSGGTDVYIPNTGEITVSHSAVSGKFSSDIPVKIQSGAAYNFSSVSGSTNIYVLG